MCFTTVHIHDEVIRQSINRLDRVLTEYVPTAKLPTVATSPRVDNSMLIYRRRMVEPQSQSCHFTILQLSELSRDGLFEDVDVA